MFSYYGSKSKIVHLYPKPLHDKIIEPFAGSARYALRYWDRDVLLVDKYEVIVNIWKYLQNCSKQDILKIPKLAIGQTLDEVNFDCVEQRNLFGFIIGNANQSPRNKANFRAIEHRPNFFDYQKKQIANNLSKIKHWEIILGSYEDLKNEQATWFIDPPYQFGGEVYINSNKSISYPELAEWCKNRSGQVIVCENTKATWLDFKPVTKMRGSIHTTTEAIWTNYHTHYHNEQLNLF